MVNLFNDYKLVLFFLFFSLANTFINFHILKARRSDDIIRFSIISLVITVIHPLLGLLFTIGNFFITRKHHHTN